MTTCSAQRGNVLVTVLLLLPVTVIFSLSMLGGVASQTKMAGNLQQKKVASIAAESAIHWKWDMQGLFGAATEKVQDIRTEELDTDFAIEGSDIEARVTVCYQGEVRLPVDIELNADESANAYRMAQQVFIVTGEAKESVTHAHSKILQAGYVIRPATGISGNDCS